MGYCIEITPKVKKQLKVHKSGTKATRNRISDIMDVLAENPFMDVFGFEHLRHNLSWYCSMVINSKDRVIYKVTDKTVYIVSVLGHYDDK